MIRVGIMLIMAVFIGRLFYLQVIRHGYYEQRANEIHISKLTINPERGLLYAREKGSIVPLVLNETVYTVFADPQAVNDRGRVLSVLRAVAGGEMLDGVEAGLSNTRSQYTVLARQISRAQAELIRKANLVGIGLQETSRRVYPEGSLAAQTLGYVDANGDGQYGIEGKLQTRLAGTPGMLRAVTDVRQIPLTIGDQGVRVPARDGDNIVLTIERTIQARAEALLKVGLDRAKATTGSIVVMDPADGSVLAMANYPTFSPAAYSTVDPRDYGVFQNKVVSYPYEAGSVIKTLTMGAGLDSGAVAPNNTYNNTGSVKIDDTTIKNVEEDPIDPHASMTDILRYSLNTGVVHILQQMGGGDVNRRARTTLYDYFAVRYRFGQATGIEQAGEADGIIIPPDNVQGNNVRYANMTFGQGMDVTMIQTAAAFSAAINGGTLYRPHLEAGVLDAGGNLRPTTPTVLGRGVLSQTTSAQLREMIYQGRKQGFFGRLDPAGYHVGGKTGTSQVIDSRTGRYSNDNSVGSYLGFGGADTPRYVIMVRVDDAKVPGYAGTSAAGPIFNDMSNWLLKYLQIPPVL